MKRILVLAVAAVLASLAGCSSSGAPDVKESASTPASPSSPRSAQVPVSSSAAVNLPVDVTAEQLASMLGCVRNQSDGSILVPIQIGPEPIKDLRCTSTRFGRLQVTTYTSEADRETIDSFARQNLKPGQTVVYTEGQRWIVSYKPNDGSDLGDAATVARYRRVAAGVNAVLGGAIRTVTR